MFVAERSSQARQQPGLEIDLCFGKPLEGLLEQWHEPGVVSGPLPGISPPVPERRLAERAREAAASRDGSRLQERLLRCTTVAQSLGLAEGEKQLAANLVVSHASELERIKRHLVKARCLLVRE